MSSPLVSASPGGLALPRYQRLLGWGETAFFALLFVGMIVNFLPVLKTAPQNGLLLLSEAVVLVFMLVRREPRDVSSRPFEWLIAMVGTAAPLLVHPKAAISHPGVQMALPSCLMMFGVGFSIWGKLTLRRSFGLVAANRGIIARGPYGFVRHPIYVGYILIDIGGIIINPTLSNAMLYTFAFTVMILRILAEERILKLDDAYVAYMRVVRYRLAPWIF